MVRFDSAFKVFTLTTYRARGFCDQRIFFFYAFFRVRLLATFIFITTAALYSNTGVITAKSCTQSAEQSVQKHPYGDLI